MSDKKMTLAEAIVLGSTHMKPRAGNFMYDDWASGCAIGMAMFAHGKIDTKALVKLHPVLNAPTTGYPHNWPLMSHITSTFDNKIMRTRKANRQAAFNKLLEEIATYEREFEAAAAQKAATETTTNTANKRRKTVTAPV